MTRQEIFDTAATALIKQGRPGIIITEGGSAVCAYFGDGGVRCAVGHMMNDWEISLYGDFEGGLDSIFGENPDHGLRQFFSDERELLLEIQGAHDAPATKYNSEMSRTVETPHDEWLHGFKAKMEEIAYAYDLDASALKLVPDNGNPCVNTSA
jgi:hypothetical protein